MFVNRLYHNRNAFKNILRYTVNLVKMRRMKRVIMTRKIKRYQKKQTITTTTTTTMMIITILIITKINDKQ